MLEIEKRTPKLIRKLERDGVAWQIQGQAERRQMASLVANNKMSILLIKFLKTMELRAREGVKEKGAE